MAAQTTNANGGRGCELREGQTCLRRRVLDERESEGADWKVEGETHSRLSKLWPWSCDFTVGQTSFYQGRAILVYDVTQPFRRDYRLLPVADALIHGNKQ